jgi:hypothetical protein
MILLSFIYNKMPRRNKKSTAKKPKGSKSGISINIKNIMKQVQNERPPQDFINLTGKKPMDGTNTGYMTRLQVPAMTYASRPLSQFPSLASISNIDRGFAPPLSQLTSNSRPPLGSAPIVTPAQERLNDVLETYRPPEVAIGPNPVVPTPAASGYSSRAAALTTPVERYLVPAGLPSRLLDAYDGKEDPLEDESQFLVAGQVPAYIGARERVAAMAAAAVRGRGRPPKEAGAAKSPYIKKEEREAIARQRVGAMVAARSPQP